jgi:hemerythrin
VNGENIAKQLKMDLQLWLINHIEQDDKNYQKIVQEMLFAKK